MRQNLDNQDNKEQPLLSLRMRYSMWSALMAHPVRVFIFVVCFLVFTRDIRMLAGDHVWIVMIWIAALAGVTLLPVLLVRALDVRAVRYDFYADHMSFPESFLIRERARLPYRSLTHIEKKQNMLQKKLGLADIVMHAEVAGIRRIAQVIRDIDEKTADATIERICAIAGQNDKVGCLITGS